MRVIETENKQRLVRNSRERANAILQVRVLRTRAEIEEIRCFWLKIQRQPNADIDFFLEVLASRQKKQWQPHVLLLYRNGAPDAILVGRREKSRMNLKIGYAAFLKPWVRALIFIYGGLMGNTCAENCEAFAVSIKRSLRENEADVAYFNHLEGDSPLYTALNRVGTFFTRDHFPMLQTHRGIVLPERMAEIWQGLSSKVRKNQRWQAKKLCNAHGGNVRIRCFKDLSELGFVMREMEQIARKTYQRALGVGFIDDTEMRAQLHLKVVKGWLRIFVLYLEGKPCAYWAGTIYHGTFHSDLMGYDPEYSKYSPGMYLVMQVIEGFREPTNAREVDSIDFGLGDAQYKEVLGNMQWQDASLYCFAPHARGLMLNALRTPLLLADRAARRALQKARLVQDVKSFWRHRLTKAVKVTPNDVP
jgi:Acetyltransferase (GNAT) domain